MIHFIIKKLNILFFYYKMNIRNDLQLSLKIAEYLLEPSILIIGHSYDKFNNLTLKLDSEFSNSQIKYYINHLYIKYTNIYFINKIEEKNHTILFSIIADVKELNSYIKIIDHRIYVKYNYLKEYSPNILLSYDIINTNNYIYDLTVSLNLDEIYNITFLEKCFNEILTKILIKNHQLTMIYWNNYFQQYLDFIDNNLNNFKVTDLIEFIEMEETIIRDLLDF